MKSENKILIQFQLLQPRAIYLSHFIRNFIFIFLLFVNFSAPVMLSISATAASQPHTTQLNLTPPTLAERVNQDLVYQSVNQIPTFDLPVTYNSKVRTWINFFQTNGRRDFKKWLERSNRYLPKIIPLLEQSGLPRDLAFLAMIESGFSPRAVSSAEAVGYWQFMKPTAERYGLKMDWWIDERRDIVKSTIAAARYLNDLYRMFNSWYLAASAYNMGEGRVKQLIKRHSTTNYWILSKQRDFPKETEQYIPKLIAAMLIAKAPKLYGFRDLQLQDPYRYQIVAAPGGTDLENLALYIGEEPESISRLNPEIIKGFIPQSIEMHKIRVPAGKVVKAQQFLKSSLVMSN